MSKDNFSSGQAGEAQASVFLQSQGYQIILRNFKARGAEIDIIARDKDFICFIEVKSRSSQRFGLPQEAITPDKQRKISRAALIFLKENDLLEKPCRFDVVAISRQDGKNIFSLIRDAFIFSE